MSFQPSGLIESVFNSNNKITSIPLNDYIVLFTFSYESIYNKVNLIVIFFKL